MHSTIHAAEAVELRNHFGLQPGNTRMRMAMKQWILPAALVLLLAGCNQPGDGEQAAQATKAAANQPQPASGQDADIAGIKASLAKNFPQMAGASIKPSVIPGLYQITNGALIGYISADGKYLLEGDLMEIATQKNLTEQVRSSWRKAQLAELDEDDMIIFEPEEVKHTITVFTDVECPFCRKLQGHMGAMLERGIRVRYLFMPVHGPKSVKEAGWVWCADDRKQAFSEAMQGKRIKKAECKNPVRAQMTLGSRLGVRGTPGIITESGKLLRGYMPPDALLAQLTRDKPGS